MEKIIRKRRMLAIKLIFKLRNDESFIGKKISPNFNYIFSVKIILPLCEDL